MNALPLLRRVISAVCAAAVGFAAVSCSRETAADGPRRLLIVTTTTMVTDTLRAIAGDEATVQPLMGPGVDPHLFKPGQEDIRHLQKADIIFYSGLHLEGRMSEIMERLQSQGKRVYALADALDKAAIITADGQPDPHIWGDAAQWAAGAAFAGEKLAAAFPEKAAAFRERAAAAQKALTETHERLKTAAASIPAAQRVLITSHDAFRYFGRAYGFEVVGIQGISTVSEADLAGMARIVDFIRQRSVRAIFVETSVAHATIETISRDTGAKIGGELYSDALGQPGDFLTIGDRKVDRGTVAGMLEANMHTIVTALKN